MTNDLIEFPYNRKLAIEYAHRWAYDRNPAFTDFQNMGGDCTNFASQCIYAGSGVMNFTPVFGWYYININERAAAWTGVKYLYNFLTTNKSSGPFARECDISEVVPGDICQLAINQPYYHHTPFIVSTGRTPTLKNILVAAHTRDADFRPLSTYKFHAIRFLHIEAVRKYATDK